MREKIENILKDYSDVKGVELHVDEEAGVFVSLEVDPARGTALEDMRQSVERKILDIDGIEKASVVLTAQKKPAPAKKPDINEKLHLPHIKKIIAVASGKGGVGKSTVAAAFAVGLAQEGLHVGLLDADIYGPSMPKMFGLQGQKPKGEQGRIEPMEVAGIKLMSIGFLVNPDKALVWRGPMVQTALTQLLRDVVWASEEEPLDVLIVDMPPGTGDAQLTLSQKVSVDGVVIVSTPQDMALIDARKGIEMFQKVNVPILGLVENMSTHVCTNCGHEDHIFGHGGAEEEASKFNVPFLGAVPLQRGIRENADNGAASENVGVFKGITARLVSVLK